MRLLQTSLICVLVLLATQAFAQIQTEPTEIITATPVSTFSDRSGIWPTVEIPQDDLNASARPLTDTLNTLPGIQARDSGSPTLSIRGSGQADRVLKLFDGWPLNFADGLGAPSLFIPEEVIGSLRLLKGPASVFYGSFAMAGALDLRTRLFNRPAARITLSDDSGQLGTKNIFGVLPIGKGDVKTSQVTIFAEDAPGQYSYNDPLGSGRLQNNDVKTYRATFTADKKWGVFKLHPTVLIANQNGEAPSPLYSPSALSYKSYGTLFGLDASTSLNETDDLTFRVSDLRLWREDNDSSGQSFSNVARSALNIDWKKTLAKSIVMRTFADSRWDALSGTYVASTVLGEFQTEIGQSYEIPLSDSLTLEPAYRYLPTYGSLVKALGLRHSTDHIQTWFTYSEGFRNASLSDRFSNTNYFKGNANLVPETSKGFELGSRFEQGRRYGGFLDGWALGATAYSNQFENIYDTMSLASGVIQKINAGSAHTRGVEVDAAYGYSVWTLTGSHSYLDAVNDSTGEALRLAPRNQSSIALSNQLGPAIIEVKETIWSSYSDKDLSNVTHQLGGWSTTDFNIRTIGLADYELKAGVLNLFDVAREYTYGYPERQRRFYMSALEYF